MGLWLRGRQESIKSEPVLEVDGTHGNTQDDMFPKQRLQVHRKQHCIAALWIFLWLSILGHTVHGVDVECSQSCEVNHLMVGGGGTGSVGIQRLSNDAELRHNLGRNTEYNLVNGMVWVGILVAVSGSLGGLCWPGRSSSRKQAARKRSRRPRGRKVVSEKSVKWLPKGAIGKAWILFLGSVSSWVLFAGRDGGVTTGSLSAGKGGCHGNSTEWPSTVKPRGGGLDAPGWARTRDMDNVEGGPQCGVAIAGHAWKGSLLVHRHVAQATWRAASADRPLVKAQGHSGGPTLGHCFFNEAANTAARLALALRIFAMKYDRDPGGQIFPAYGWDKAAVCDLLRWGAGGFQEAEFATTSTRAVFVARWVAGARRPWPRRSRMLLRGYYEWVLNAAVTDGIWISEREDFGYRAGAEDSNGPHAASKATPDGPFATCFLVPGGRLGCLTRPGYGQEQSHLDVTDHRGTTSIIHQRLCDDRHGYGDNVAWTGPERSIPPLSHSPLSSTLVDHNQMDTGHQSYDHREEGDGDERSEMALRITRSHRRDRMHTGPAVAEGGKEDPATHGRVGDGSDVGSDVGKSRDDDGGIWGKIDGGRTKLDRMCPEADSADESALPEVFRDPCSGTDYGYDGSDSDGRGGSNGSGYQRSLPPPPSGPGREAQRMHAGGRACVQDCVRKARRHAGAPRCVTSIDTTMNLHAEDECKRRESGLRQRRGVVANTRRPLQIPHDDIDIRRASNGGWDAEQWGTRRQQADGGGAFDLVHDDATVCLRWDRKDCSPPVVDVCQVSDVSEGWESKTAAEHRCPKRRYVCDR